MRFISFPKFIMLLIAFWTNDSRVLSQISAFQNRGITQATNQETAGTAMLGVNPQRTREYNSPPILEPKTLIWKTAKLFVVERSYPVIVTLEARPPIISAASMSSGHGFTEPVVAGNTIYFSVYINDGYVYAQDCATGKDKWRFKLKGVGPSAPAIDDGVLYVSGSDGTFYALNAATGQELWKKAQKGSSFSTASPIVANGIVYFSSTEASGDYKVRPDGRVFALDGKTGNQFWVFKTKGMVSAAAYASKTLFVGDSDGYLHALDAETGQERWKLKSSGDGVRTPSVIDGVVYFPSYDGSLHAVDAQTGQERWRNTNGPKAATQLALHDSTLYFGGDQHSLYAVDAVTGRLKWEYKTSKQCAAPVLAGGVVYFSSYDGVISALDAAVGTEKWKLNNLNKVLSPPLLAGGSLYFLDGEGHLYALR